jgi:hypothetical protein
MTTPARAFQFLFVWHFRNWLNMKLWPFLADQRGRTYLKLR